MADIEFNDTTSKTQIVHNQNSSQKQSDILSELDEKIASHERKLMHLQSEKNQLHMHLKEVAKLETDVIKNNNNDSSNDISIRDSKKNLNNDINIIKQSNINENDHVPEKERKYRENKETKSIYLHTEDKHNRHYRSFSSSHLNNRKRPAHSDFGNDKDSFNDSTLKRPISFYRDTTHHFKSQHYKSYDHDFTRRHPEREHFIHYPDQHYHPRMIESNSNFGPYRITEQDSRRFTYTKQHNYYSKKQRKYQYPIQDSGIDFQHSSNYYRHGHSDSGININNTYMTNFNDISPRSHAEIPSPRDITYELSEGSDNSYVISRGSQSYYDYDQNYNSRTNSNWIDYNNQDFYENIRNPVSIDIEMESYNRNQYSNFPQYEQKHPSSYPNQSNSHSNLNFSRNQMMDERKRNYDYPNPIKNRFESGREGNKLKIFPGRNRSNQSQPQLHQSFSTTQDNNSRHWKGKSCPTAPMTCGEMLRKRSSASVSSVVPHRFSGSVKSRDRSKTNRDGSYESLKPQDKYDPAVGYAPYS